MSDKALMYVNRKRMEIGKDELVRDRKQQNSHSKDAAEPGGAAEQGGASVAPDIDENSFDFLMAQLAQFEK